MFSVSAYNATVEQCGKSDGITAMGARCTEGRTVACNDLPLGTLIRIGSNVYRVEDRMASSGCIDIYMDSYEDAMRFGRKTMEVEIVE